MYKINTEDEKKLAKLGSYQQAILRILAEVPKGKVTTYGDLAKELSKRDSKWSTKSSRAVGTTMRNNPCGPQIPCRARARDGNRVVVSFSPIDGENTMMYLRSYWKTKGVPGVNWITGIFSGIGSWYIADQDRKVVVSQTPKRVGVDIGEKLISADLPIAIYRQESDRLIRKAVNGS